MSISVKSAARDSDRVYEITGKGGSQGFPQRRGYATEKFINVISFVIAKI